MTTSAQQLRGELNDMDRQIARLLQGRFDILDRLRGEGAAASSYDPSEEARAVDAVLRETNGSRDAEAVRRVFGEVFRASAERSEAGPGLRVRRAPGQPGSVYEVRGHRIGDAPQLIAGPCSIESYEQTRAVGERLHSLGVRFLRGGAYKPRTSPYAFQGLKEEGLKIMRQVTDELGMVAVTEILDPRDLERIDRHADVFQVGTRNMFNYDLLRLLGETRKPVLLKRGLMATLEELILAAEYIAERGNEQIILCERGVRSFEKWTRNTLDLAAVPLLLARTPFPVVVDVAHATGRKDIMVPLARAALAAGAAAVMVESHPNPALALSDNEQQMDLEEIGRFVEAVFAP
ncbi:bifunctional 3-deoxy-7-phosphoheptulonate synthase/chorismate mutase [Myxococcota bacterium]|nr:bifunctional 3-deoxy-7-phosphoheptulonate synthase/chorismate mutase [Myxococcota bacterium]